MKHKFDRRKRISEDFIELKEPYVRIDEDDFYVLDNFKVKMRDAGIDDASDVKTALIRHIFKGVKLYIDLDVDHDKGELILKNPARLANLQTNVNSISFDGWAEDGSGKKLAYWNKVVIGTVPIKGTAPAAGTYPFVTFQHKSDLGDGEFYICEPHEEGVWVNVSTKLWQSGVYADTNTVHAFLAFKDAIYSACKEYISAETDFTDTAKEAWDNLTMSAGLECSATQDQFVDRLNNASDREVFLNIYKDVQATASSWTGKIMSTFNIGDSYFKGLVGLSEDE